MFTLLSIFDHLHMQHVLQKECSPHTQATERILSPLALPSFAPPRRVVLLLWVRVCGSVVAMTTVQLSPISSLGQRSCWRRLEFIESAFLSLLFSSFLLYAFTYPIQPNISPLFPQVHLRQLQAFLPHNIILFLPRSPPSELRNKGWSVSDLKKCVAVKWRLSSVWALRLAPAEMRNSTVGRLITVAASWREGWRGLGYQPSSSASLDTLCFYLFYSLSFWS